jgi:hypothetical protein
LSRRCHGSRSPAHGLHIASDKATLHSLRLHLKSLGNDFRANTSGIAHGDDHRFFAVNTLRSLNWTHERTYDKALGRVVYIDE